MRFSVCTLPTAPWDELVRRWRELDGIGFETIWVPDQIVPRPGLPWLEAWTMLGALSQVTDRARIGPLVSPIVLRNPGVLAKASVTLDHASGGRAELGIGAGGHSLDHRKAGVEDWPATERDRRLREFVEREALPQIEEHHSRESFPLPLIARMAELGFFGANTSYTQIRLESSSTAVPNRVVVEYRDYPWAHTDPVQGPTTTVTGDRVSIPRLFIVRQIGGEG